MFVRAPATKGIAPLSSTFVTSFRCLNVKRAELRVFKVDSAPAAKPNA